MSAVRHRFLLFFIFATLFVPRGNAFSLALDSVRTWGKFPNFCVDVYRWGDKFFNTYDTAYVSGTNFKFNIKNRTETWGDMYRFKFDNDVSMQMRSDACTSTGFYATYLALSLGYDLNVSSWFGNKGPARNRFVFGFNCALFSAELSWISNDVSTRIKRFGTHNHIKHYDIPFTGLNTNIFSLNILYALNNKRYSRAAAFNYSKIQKRSQGSFFFGFSYWTQNFKFNFDELPDYMKQDLPTEWADYNYRYNVVNKNYSLIAGYGYNWVFAPHWLLGVAESPVFGIKDGFINSDNTSKLTFSMYNQFRASVVWNNRHWFAGAILKIENGLVYDKTHTLLNTVMNGELSVGYRFNLW